MTSADPPPSGFGALWDALSDVLGSSAAATLMRRAAKHAATHHPDLNHLVIRKPSLDYEYSVPATWSDPVAEETAIRALWQSLAPLLVELTGELVINRLRSNATIRSLLTGDES